MSIDWQTIFSPDIPLLETFVRGTAVYFALLIMMRISKREAGEIGLSDMLVVVLLADAIQNGMAGDYKSLPNGLLLVATILFWDFAVNWVSYYIPFIEKQLSPKKVCLIKNGKMLKRNMQNELITRSELMEQLRVAGVEEIEKVRHVYMEASGKLSVIKYKD